MARPNILYIFTDQQSGMALSCAGNTNLATPNLDRLAARGVRFTRAYSQYPLCTPARASMLTGRMPHEIGMTWNDQPIAQQYIGKGLGHTVAAAGYDCGYGGKWHVPQWEIPDGEHGFRKIAGLDDLALASSCISFMKEQRAKPFFLVASFDDPHNICEWGRQQNLPWGSIGPEPPLEEMPNLPANYAIPPFEPVCIRQWYNNFLAFMVSDEMYCPKEWRRYRWGYNRLVERVDAQIGKILEGLAELGLADDTVVIFASDHGDQQGEHRLAQKSLFYEASVCVPFVIAGPGVEGPGRTDDTLINACLDLYSTVCDYAQAEDHANSDARSLRPLVEDTSAVLNRDHVVAETSLGNSGCGRMIRTERFKYCAYEQGLYSEQLIDMAADSGEMVNLAVERRHEPVLQEHRELLRAWCTRTGDSFGHHYAHPDRPFQVPGDDKEV